MNILIPQNWLKDYVKTDVSPEEIARLLSLHAFSVEKITKVPRLTSLSRDENDYIFEIEVTPNRGDALSVLGIARELKAILPLENVKSEWVARPEASPVVGEEKYDLAVEIKDKTLVPRFSAIILDNIQIKDSPVHIKERLESVGTRALNNVIDITNYLMFDKGQPMHAFDYDKILGAKMTLRESKKGEKVVTLDSVERELPAGVIVIEDGEGRLIDLCGIMGAKNSEVDENTKRVLLFVQAYDPVRIRKSSMALGHRTEAALRFEKGIDFAGVVPALWEAVEFLRKEAGAGVASKLIDIINVETPIKKVAVDYAKINLVAGVDIPKEIIDRILENLGFVFEGNNVVVPSWRYDDIAIAEDLAEEVIRLYGYDKLPNHLLTGEIPDFVVDKIFFWENKAKDYLKHQGFFECYTHSTTSRLLAGQDAIKIVNPLSEGFSYLKTSLLPQLLAVVDKNQGYKDKIRIFEIASVYVAKENNLPDQPLRLGIVVKGVNYLEFKGIIEGLLEELRISDFYFMIQKFNDDIFGTELDFEELVKRVNQTKEYAPISPFNSIKEDLTFMIPEENISYQQITDSILSVDSRIEKLQFSGMYKNCLTLAIEYLDRKQQISSDQVQRIRQEIFYNLDQKLNVKLKA